MTRTAMLRTVRDLCAVYGPQELVWAIIRADQVLDPSQRPDLIQVPASVSGTHFPTYAVRGEGCPPYPES